MIRKVASNMAICSENRTDRLPPYLKAAYNAYKRIRYRPPVCRAEERAGTDSTMEDAGQKLKRARERLNLRYRDVEEASLRIAELRKNDEFIINLSRLADIENKGTIPSIFRIYSLSAIYRLEPFDVMEWYGVDFSRLAADSTTIDVEKTHMIGFSANGHGAVQVPLSLDPGIDQRRTTYISRLIQRWGKVPLMLLNGVELRDHRYAFIGSEDW